MTKHLNLGETSFNERPLESDIDIEMETISELPVLEDDDEEPFTVTKKRINNFSDSGSDSDTHNNEKENLHNESEKGSDEEEVISLKLINKRSRIQNIQDSDTDDEFPVVNLSEKQKHYESVRTENKKKNLKEKFKNLISSKYKETENLPLSDFNSAENTEDDNYCGEINEILRTSLVSMNTLCDPDTSDEDEDREEKTYKSKHKSKRTNQASEKPLRMSAKQAMENMQKIKSESNRMLREKEVSLPYHRPKALSLKDIMSRRKPAVSADGKALPIKMNEDQLKQYAKMLEQRQKEVIELCKSDTDEEDEQQKDKKFENGTVDMKNDTELINNHQNNEIIEKEENNLSGNEEKANDKLFDNEQVIKQSAEIEKGTEQEQEKVKNVDVSIVEELNEQEDVSMNNINEDVHKEDIQESNTNSKPTEDESQVMLLHYDTEKCDSVCEKEDNNDTNMDQSQSNQTNKNETSKSEDSFEGELNYDEIDKFIAIAVTQSDVAKTADESLAVNHVINKNPCPKLTGCPGSFINLDGDDSSAPRKLSGVEMLKERFTYYAKLNSLEETEKDREKKYKPGTQHLKLKQELEQQISEQRSMEWEKRLEEEKQLKSEMNALSDDDIEKIEAKLEEIETEDKPEESSESEEELIEDDVVLKDKPIKRNPMVDDEAEESDCDDDVGQEEIVYSEKETEADGDDESSDSSESEEDDEPKPRKGRILKAFQDSDDESEQNNLNVIMNNEETNVDKKTTDVLQEGPELMDTEIIKESQDDDLQLAQANKSSDDLFSTQGSNTLALGALNKNSEDNISYEMGTQSFSILNSLGTNNMVDLDSPGKTINGLQSQDGSSLDHVVKLCSGTFSQNIVNLPDAPPLSQSQEIGDDIAALCTGKFYDNPFVSQEDKKNIYEESQQSNASENSQTQEFGDDVAALCTGKFYNNQFVSQDNDKMLNSDVLNTETTEEKGEEEKTILKSVLDELNEPELVVPKQNKFFFNSQSKKTEVIESSQMKKKFVIDSDDENDIDTTIKKIKKLKKRKAEHRALQISDDEEESDEEEEGSFESEIDQEERIVEYDSEENEVEVHVKPLKKKRVGEFFENEAELTSEDEWVGSGDEDEKGLDRMEQEEGDNDVFHQEQLQRELGQIHMREVLDQDKREVRLLQELLFEDGDLGDGHRQRKFRWRNADGEIETGTNPDELPDTQEDEFESEEQWRKQRHEREMFLRKMQEKDQENLDTTINRTTIIKANLESRSMSTLISETKTNIGENKATVPEKKSSKDIPSPKKPFTIFQQSYHGSLLTRGRGALARLAALATPLATDNDDAPKVIQSANRRNFVFAAVTDEEPKVTKRKADKPETPRLIKKMKTEDTTKYIKNSLFDHLKA